MMSFDLRITFTGMCLFVPDGRNPADLRMHVLLPATDEHPHDARLMFNAAYASGSSTLERTLACRVLDRQAIRLAGPSGGAAQELPSEIVNLRLTLDKRVTPDKLEDRPSAAVKSRITLFGGAVTDYELGAAWDMPYHKGIPMTWRVDWTVRGIDGNMLQWQLVSLDTGEITEELPRLRPIGGVVHIFVYHVISDELPGTFPPPVLQVPNEGDRAEHFPAFFGLATGGINEAPKFKGELQISTTCPVLMDAADHPAAHHHAAHATLAGAVAPRLFVLGTEYGGSPFTCMTATAPIG